LNHGEVERRPPIPSRLRTASVSSIDPGALSDRWPSPNTPPTHATGSSESSAEAGSTARRRSSAHSSDRALKVLIAEDNPISAKVILIMIRTEDWFLTRIADLGNSVNADGMSMYCRR
jgi:hypothetical protein